MAVPPNDSGSDKKNKSVLAAAAHAMEAIVGKAKTVGFPTINDPDILVNTRGAQEVVKGTQMPSFVWVAGPAMLLLNATAAKRLPRVSKAMGVAVNQVNKVRAAHKRGTKIVYIWPADDEDVDAYAVTTQGSATFVNLVEFLGPLGLTITSGYKESYALEYTLPGDSVHPALKFDMEKPLDRRPTRRKPKPEAATAEKPGTDKTTADKHKTDKNQPDAIPEPKAEA